MGLAGLRLLWPVLEALVPLIFQLETVESIAKSPPFTWWPNLTEGTRWFGLNETGQGLVQALLGIVLCGFGWVGAGGFIFFGIPRMLSNWSKKCIGLGFRQAHDG